MKETWGRFKSEVEARTSHLLADVEASWNDIQAASAIVEAALRQGYGPPESGKLAALRAFMDAPCRALASDAIGQLQRRRPLQRALTAYEDWTSGLGDAARGLPQRETLCAKDCADAAGVALPLWPRLRGQRKRPLAVRAVVLAETARLELERSRIDGQWQLLLAQAAMLTPAPWIAVSHDGLIQAAGMPQEIASSDFLARIERQWAQLRERAPGLLADYRIWSVRATDRLNACLIDPPRKPEAAREPVLVRRGRHFAFWSRQQRAVHAWLDTQSQFWRLGVDCLEESERVLESLSAEYADLAAETGQVLEWLGRAEAETGAGTFPSPQAKLVAAGERAAEWVRRLEEQSRRRLADVIEAVQPKRALPGWRESWRRIEPRRLVMESLQAKGRELVRDGLKEAEAAHSAMVREVERAREVVSFGFEQAGEADAAEGLAEEAAANAIGLLTHQCKHSRDPRPSVEPVIVRALAAALVEVQTNLDKGRLGLLAHATRQRGVTAALELAAAGAGATRRAASKVLTLGDAGVRWVLLKAGLATPMVKRAEAVKKRPALGATLALRLGERDLPALYRRLFRLAPVEDPRFLIGREAEMAGLTEAVRQWHEGRHAAILVIGARGSGKTSLLNCAAADPLAGHEIVRAQFSDRIKDTAQMRRFVSQAISLDESGNLEEALLGRRRVMILEELERVYLGVIGGYEALRHLLDLVEETSGSTLWVLSLNETAFLHLDAAAALGSHFSHRINAMSVEQKQLEAAILYRHHLSGLRMQFSPLPRGDERVRRVRRTLGLEKSPQEVFFHSLYAESEGIFRAAFELWQDSIERIEGGLVHLRQPLAADYGPLIAELGQCDQFLLRAVMRHGSLTFSEAAELFMENEAWARRTMRRLESLDVLEPDPSAAGYRVMPQAGKVVRELLFRSNLH